MPKNVRAAVLERASPFYVSPLQMNQLPEDVLGREPEGLQVGPDRMGGILSPRVELTDGETKIRIAPITVPQPKGS